MSRWHEEIAIIGGGIAGAEARLSIWKKLAVPAQTCNGFCLKNLTALRRNPDGRHDGFVIEAGLSLSSASARRIAPVPGTGIGDQRFLRMTWPQNPTYWQRQLVLIRMDGVHDPTRIWPMETTPPVFFKTKLRIAAELFSSARKDTGDEPVGDFVRRHFGQEMVDRVVEPLLAGVLRRQC